MNNFTQRAISSVVYALSVIVLIVFSDGCYASLFDTVLAAVMLGAVYEFHHLTGSSRFNIVFSMLTTLFLYISVVSWTPGGPFYTCLYANYVKDLFFILAVCMLMVGWIAQLWLKRPNPIQEWGNNLLSIVMVAVPFMLMTRILAMNKWLLLALFVIIWLNDAGAYIIGSLTAKLPKGNHKMFPRVSPAKSWEGLFGGVALALLTGYIFALYVPDYPVWQWLIMALLIAVFGNLGDLMESLLKRTVGVKDSGRFLPGHGGVLDRFDSLLLATPVIYLLFTFN